MAAEYDAMDLIRNRNGDGRARRRSSESEERPAAKESKETPEKPKEAKKNTLDREKTCPLLLRVFCSTSRHNPMNEYNRGKKVLLLSIFFAVRRVRVCLFGAFQDCVLCHV